MSALLVPRARRKGISLTALIDVVFILLMFFMLTSSFTQWRAVDLVSPSASTAASTREPQVFVIDADGALELVGGEFALAHYDQLRARHLGRLDASRPVVLVPEAEVSVQSLVAALEQLKAIGLTQVTLGQARKPDAQ